jgi:cyanophycinase
MKPPILKLCVLFLLITAFTFQSVQADQAPMRTLIPIGSGYAADTLQLFARAAVQRDTSGVVDLLVLPITYGTDAYSTTPGERKKNLDLAETRRQQVEDACNIVLLPGQTCRALLAPVLIREDAFLQSNLDLFASDLDGIYILGGDQTIAMQVVANTPFEQRMKDAFDLGAVVSGNSAGAAVQSRNMINGYIGANGPENGFQQGSVDLWMYDGPTDETRGLSFGISNAIFEQHTFQRGRIARLINASFSTGLLGIGLDADTGAVVTDETSLSTVTGATSAIVVDLQTYQASGSFGGPTSSLSIRGVVTHLIPPGEFGYNLIQRQPLVDGVPQPAPDIAGRAFDALQLPAGYGPLLLAGDLSGDLAGSATQRFVELSGGSEDARLVVIVLGHAKSSDARAAAKAYASALETLVAKPVKWFVVDAKVDQSAVLGGIAGATGILISAPDPSRVLDAFAAVPGITSALDDAWTGGKAVLMDNAAAAAVAQAISVDPTPTSGSLEDDSMGDFLLSGVSIQPGLNWLPGVAVEARMVMDRHWGRLYNHLHRDSALLGLGIDVDTAIELTASGATAWGRNTVTVLDGRYASYALGTNGALAESYVLLDTFVEGESLLP